MKIPIILQIIPFTAFINRDLRLYGDVLICDDNADFPTGIFGNPAQLRGMKLKGYFCTMNINTRFYGSNSIAEYGVGVCRIQY